MLPPLTSQLSLKFWTMSLAISFVFLIAPHLLAAPRPNIIVILGDDIGFSDLGCYGSEINTPNLDALANDGLRFTQFYNTARCCPSRACAAHAGFIRIRRASGT